MTSERTVTADFDEVDRIMAEAITTIRTDLGSDETTAYGIDFADDRDQRAAEHLADLLDELSDEMNDGKAAEVRIHANSDGHQLLVTDDHGHGQTNHTWTAALKLARVIAGGPDDPQAHR